MRTPLDRARSLLDRPGAWIDGPGIDGPGPDTTNSRYLIRVGPDRRARISLTVDEPTFRALIDRPGLKARPGGGWVARPAGSPAVSPEPGRPGFVEGRLAVIETDGRLNMRRANVGESPIAWLARRKDSSGRPWLTPAEIAAGERLRRDAETAGAGPSVTMRWDALPRSGGGSAARVEPGDRALSASARVDAALASVSPRVRPFVVQICLRGSSLQLAEQAMGLRRRQGRTLLKQGLAMLAEHYGIG